MPVAETGLRLAATEFLIEGIGWRPRSIIASAPQRGELQGSGQILPPCPLQIALLRPQSDAPRWTEAPWQDLTSGAAADRLR